MSSDENYYNGARIGFSAVFGFPSGLALGSAIKETLKGNIHTPQQALLVLCGYSISIGTPIVTRFMLANVWPKKKLAEYSGKNKLHQMLNRAKDVHAKDLDIALPVITAAVGVVTGLCI